MELKITLSDCSASPVVPETDDFYQASGGVLYWKQGTQIVSCPDTEEGRNLMALLCGERETEPIITLDAAYRFLLTGHDPERRDMLIRRFGIPGNRERRVILFRRRSGDERLYPLLTELAPVEAEDLLVKINEDTVAFIRQGDDPEGEDTLEYARAVAEMAETEAGIRLWAGIGNPRSSGELLHESRQEAEQAIRIGRMFHLPGPVFLYQGQMLERLLSEIPRESGNRLCRQMFTPATDALMTDGTREILQALFRNDLNQTITAKELFLHRNTLGKRLDRIRQETGLDLRRFQDAVVFKVFMELRDLIRETELPER